MEAVTEGLKVVRDGNFFRWRDNYFSQISGCALGDVDSCSYTDIAMSDLLDEMVPACESTLSTEMDPFFKIFRDDGLGISFDSPEVVPNIQNFFNAYDPSIQWTIPEC